MKTPVAGPLNRADVRTSVTRTVAPLGTTSVAHVPAAPVTVTTGAPAWAGSAVAATMAAAISSDLPPMAALFAMQRPTPAQRVTLSRAVLRATMGRLAP